MSKKNTRCEKVLGPFSPFGMTMTVNFVVDRGLVRQDFFNHSEEQHRKCESIFSEIRRGGGRGFTLLVIWANTKFYFYLWLYKKAKKVKWPMSKIYNACMDKENYIYTGMCIKKLNDFEIAFNVTKLLNVFPLISIVWILMM